MTGRAVAELVGLSDVAGNRDHFTIIIVFFQPGNNDGSIQTPGISKYDLFDIFFVHENASVVYLCNYYPPKFRFVKNKVEFYAYFIEIFTN